MKSYPYFLLLSDKNFLSFPQNQDKRLRIKILLIFIATMYLSSDMYAITGFVELMRKYVKIQPKDTKSWSSLRSFGHRLRSDVTWYVQQESRGEFIRFHIRSGCEWDAFYIRNGRAGSVIVRESNCIVTIWLLSPSPTKISLRCIVC